MNLGYKQLFFLVLFCTPILLFSQQVSLSGRVTDSLSNPLEFANVIARPKVTHQKIAFSIADEKGRYKLILQKNTNYTITASYMGYTSYSFRDSLSQDKAKNIILKPSNQQLDEVIIIHQVPVTIKEDTIRYRTEAFVTGEERKLKEVLKKLPGVEVDKNSNITVQGKKVTKMLVEDKDFFGGGTKLAVENIPADAVNEVEVIDNYNKIGFLKGLSDSEEMAMNIKLKENKKRFVFGDITGGLGNDKHYLGQANLFYYSPKTNLNYIGNLNDIGYKPFTFMDYMQFQGGISKVLKDPKSFFRISSNNFSEFFEDADYQSNTAKFSALHWQQSLHPKLDFSTYGLFSDNLTQTLDIANNDYLNEGVVYLSENRENKQQNSKIYGMGRLALEYNPNTKESLEYNFFTKISSLDFVENIQTLSELNQNFITTTNESKQVKLKQDFEWHKKFTKKHTISLSFTHQYDKEKPNTGWITDKPILQTLLPATEDITYKVIQEKQNATHQINGFLKHYWVVNNLNHIYTSVGNQYLDQNFVTDTYQNLSDGTIHNFETADFNNKIHFKLNDFYAGVQYKFKKGITTFKPGLFIHFYSWTAKQATINKRSKGVLLPELDVKIEFTKSKKIDLKYQLRSNFTDATKYANRFYLLSFNSLMKGNPHLENELIHSASLRYYRFSMYRDIIINGFLTYNRKHTSIRNDYQLQGIDRFLTPVITNNPETNWQLNLNLRKGINDFYFKFRANLSLSNYQQNINENTVNTESFGQNYGVTVGTTFDKLPNIDIGFDKNINNYTSNLSKSHYTTNEPFAEISYDFLKGFILKADYRQTIFKKDSHITSKYQIANTSLFYQKENSPFGFEIKATNLTGIENKLSSNFNNYIISENQTYILPRILVFKLIYKL